MEPIDFCITLSSPSVDFLWRLFWGSLRSSCILDGVHFHLINKDISEHTESRILWSMQGYDRRMCSVPRTHSVDQPYLNSKDVDYTCDYMMNNCGTCDWVCISHFDMWFKREKDWLTFARKQIAPDVAIIGNHCPIMLINRTVYRHSKVKFACSEHVRGDTGQALQREMVELGWKVITYPEFNDPTDEKDPNGAHSYFHHIGGGGSDYDQPHIDAKRTLCFRMIEELGL